MCLSSDSFRFLLSDVDLLQAAQAAELAGTFLSSPYPAVIAADFNCVPIKSLIVDLVQSVYVPI
jgi:hypothetical protein